MLSFLWLRIYIKKSITLILCLMYARCFAYIIYYNYLGGSPPHIVQITSLTSYDCKVVEYNLNQIYYSPYCLLSMVAQVRPFLVLPLGHKGEREGMMRLWKETLHVCSQEIRSYLRKYTVTDLIGHISPLFT